MIQFILNDSDIRTDLHPGITLLDFIRYHRHLPGTKIGCREGDCGACTVIVGELADNQIRYRTVTSCLMPLGNAQGKHIVSIEGINGEGLNPVQQAMSDQGATQCGFCTPGFIMSLTHFCMQEETDDPVAAVDGNICRCTGYKSIERAAGMIQSQMKERKSESPVSFAIKRKIIPPYFNSIQKRLQQMNVSHNGEMKGKANSIYVGGGTDLYVQKHETMVHESGDYIASRPGMRDIKRENDRIILGGSVTVTDMMQSDIINTVFPEFKKYTKLVSSTPIRNMATLAGNFVNASPIGDFTVFFLALNANVVLAGERNKRTVSLRKFYKGYKKIDKTDEEFITEISFRVPGKDFHFNFEKVSKRTNLDIASVNSAFAANVSGNKISDAGITAGGVGPVPMYLEKTSEFLSGKMVSEQLVTEACSIAGEEITPISDARGSATYKRFLLQQLIRSHFITIFPQLQPEKLISAYEEY